MFNLSFFKRFKIFRNHVEVQIHNNSHSWPVSAQIPGAVVEIRKQIYTLLWNPAQIWSCHMIWDLGISVFFPRAGCRKQWTMLNLLGEKQILEELNCCQVHRYQLHTKVHKDSPNASCRPLLWPTPQPAIKLSWLPVYTACVSDSFPSC